MNKGENIFDKFINLIFNKKNKKHEADISSLSQTSQAEPENITMKDDNDDKKIDKHKEISALSSILGSLEKYNKIDIWAEKRLKHNKTSTEKRTLAPEISSSWIYRLEYILKGKTFEEVEEVVNNLYSTQNKFYKTKIQELLKERTQLSEEEVEKQLEEYNHILDLTKKDIKQLTKEEKKFLYNVYKQIKQTESSIFQALKKVDFDEDSLFKGKNFSDLQEEIAIGLAEPRFMTLDEDLNWYRTKLAENKNFVNNSYQLAINQRALFQNFERTIEILREIKQKASEQNKQVDLVIDDDGSVRKQNSKDIRVPYSYSADEIYLLACISYYVDNLYFSEYVPQTLLPFDKDRIWTWDDVMNANYHKNFIIEELKKLKLSSFEKILMIHNEVSKCSYQQVSLTDIKEYKDLALRYPKLFKEVEDELEKKDLYFPEFTPHELKGTFLTAEDSKHNFKQPLLKSQGKGFVCCGFSSYAKALVDSFKDPNIQCEYIGPIFYSKKTGKLVSGHSILLVTIKDKKYGIDGVYAWDPCWDNNEKGFAFCLFPLEDYSVYKSDDEIVKIEYHKNSTAKNSILYSSVPNKININNTNLFICDKIDLHDCEPISFEDYSDALINLTKKTRECKNYNLAPLPKDFRSKSLTNTIHHLYHFEPQSAKNAFYQDVRDFYIEKAKNGEYQDWEQNFTEYNKDLHYTPKNYEKS